MNTNSFLVFTKLIYTDKIDQIRVQIAPISLHELYLFAYTNKIESWHII